MIGLWFSEVEDDCEFVPYFDEEQVQRRLDEVPQDVVPASQPMGSTVGFKALITLMCQHSRIKIKI